MVHDLHLLYRFVAVDNLFDSESHLFTDAATSAVTRARTTRPDDLLKERSRSDSKKRHRAEIDVDDATNFGDENAVDDAIRNGNGGVRVPLSPLEELERQFMFS
jgi:signal transduction histidine kinase